MHRVKGKREERSGGLPLSDFYYRESPEDYPALEIGDVIVHTRSGSNEQFECEVLDFGTSRAKGEWFLVVYANQPGVEVELSDQEMDEILAQRIMLDSD